MKKFTLKSLFLIFPLFIVSCEDLDFYGDTFYTVKGRITDVNDQNIPNLELKIQTSRENLAINPYNDFNSGIISASCKTDQNGNFKITFPKSDGYNFLLFQEGCQIIDSINTNSYNSNLAALEITRFRNFLLDTKTIKITKP